MDDDIYIPYICVITTDYVNLKIIDTMVKQIFKVKYKSMEEYTTISQHNTITEAINKHSKNKIRAIVISLQNINLTAEFNVIKEEWPDIITKNNNSYYEKEDVCVVIDVNPVFINELDGYYSDLYTNSYSIKSDLENVASFIDNNIIYNVGIYPNDIDDSVKDKSCKEIYEYKTLLNHIINPHIICAIIPNNIKLNKIGKLAKQILSINNPKKISETIINYDTIVKVICTNTSDISCIRAIVISSQNINLEKELDVIKAIWPGIIPDNYTTFFKQKNVYFVIDVVMCFYNDLLGDCYNPYCANIYSINE